MFRIEDHLSCLNMCLFIICEYFDKQNYYIFYDVWKFSFDKEKEFSKSLFLPQSPNDCLQRFQDLSFQFINNDEYDINQKISLIQGQESMDRIIMLIDSFYCPWHKGYKKLHIQHSCFVNNYCNDKKVFVCDDPYLKESNTYITIDDFNKGSSLLHINKLINEKVVESNDINIFKSFIIEKDMEKMFNNMHDFATVIMNKEKTDELFDYPQDVYLCNITRTLKFIADSRYNLSYVFKQFKKENNGNKYFEMLAYIFEECGKKFDKINYRIIKIFYKSCILKKDLEGISKKMLEIIEKEREALNIILQL